MLVIEKLDPAIHNRSTFSCGVDALDDFLKRFAWQNQRAGHSTTHVAVDSNNRSDILGYVTLSAASMDFSTLPADARRKLPRNPLPAVRVSRLAVSKTFQGRKLGFSLLGYTIRNALNLRETLGIKALIVDAKNEKAADFYRAFGFTASIESPLVLYLLI